MRSTQIPDRFDFELQSLRDQKRIRIRVRLCLEERPDIDWPQQGTADTVSFVLPWSEASKLLVGLRRLSLPDPQGRVLVLEALE